MPQGAEESFGGSTLLAKRILLEEGSTPLSSLFGEEWKTFGHLLEALSVTMGGLRRVSPIARDLDHVDGKRCNTFVGQLSMGFIFT